MNSNPLKDKARISSVPATNPAQFPLRSAASRAAARSMVESRALSQDDRDALTLSRQRWLRADMNPSYLELNATGVYARGNALAAHIGYESRFEGRSWIVATFAFLFGRFPQAGDILRLSHTQALALVDRVKVAEFIAAWHRQLEALPCPLRFDGDRLMKRVKPKLYEPAEWLEYDHTLLDSLTSLWRDIAGDQKTCAAIFFLDEEHYRPATEQELSEDQTVATGGVLGILSMKEG